MIQIRNVPSRIHRQAKARAAMRGMTMSEYILRELEKALARPTREELLDRIARAEPVFLDDSVAALIREERERD
jgi:hypothetical protein